MTQSNEFQIVQLLKDAPHFEMNINSEKRVLDALRSVQATHKRSGSRNKFFSGVFQTGAAIAAVAILGAGLWGYEGQIVNHKTQSNTLASSNVSKTQSIHSTPYVIPQERALLPGYKILAQFKTANSTNHYYTFYEGINGKTGYRVDESAIPSNVPLDAMTSSKSDQYTEISTMKYKNVSITISKSKLSPRMWTYYFSAGGLWFQINAIGGNPINDLKVVNSLITNPKSVK